MPGKVMGYMPYQLQYGFVEYKDGTSVRALVRTIAHELGHGTFGLKHTNTPEYDISDNRQITSALNLMGYNDSTHLAKFQWDIIHERSGETEFESAEEVMIKEENPFMWLMIPRDNKNISLEGVKNFFKSLSPNYNKYGFPNEFSNDFVGFIVNRASLTMEVKAELHWRLIQTAGAIWENDGLSNVLQLLEQGKLPSWEAGKNVLEKLTPQQRAEIKKNDANKMSAILLYEFAVGSIEHSQTDFTENDAFTIELNKDDILLKEAIGKFYEDMQRANITDETSFIQSFPNKTYPTGFGFSPDHTGSIKESWEKHIKAWNNNPIMFIIGGMSAEITKNGNYFRVHFVNKMGLKSLALHLASDVNTPGPLCTTTQTFTFDLTLEQFKTYKK
jgi:hypothetical protein